MVINPRGAWKTVAAATPNASQRTHVEAAASRQAASQVTIERVSGRIATTRFPNSTAWWWSFSGKSLPWPHPGQPSQPRPEPVSLTVAPLMMIR